MKKISLLLIALIAAIAANAQIYVMGDGTGLSWTSFPGLKIEADAEGNYTHTFQSLNSFKVSNVAGTNWDGFNSGAKQLSSGSFGDAVYPGGQTLNLTSGSDKNIDTPWDGVYTLTIDKNFTTITLKTTTPKPTNAPDAYIVGEMNSWGINQAYKFNVKEEGNNYVYTLQTNLSANSNFKIAGANGSAVNWGGAINYSTGSTITEAQINNGTAITATYNNSNNMKLAVNFSGTVTLTIPKTAKQSGTIKFTKGDVEKTYPETLYLLGNVNEYAWNPTQGVKMTKTSKGVFETEATVTGADGTSVGYFAFSESLGSNDNDWAALGTRYGAKTKDLAITDGTAMDLMVTADNSFKANTGYYKIVVDLVNEKMTATSVQAPAEEFTELYVIGTLEDHVWDNNGSPAMINEGDGIFTADVTLLPADGDDKAYFAITKKLGDWDTVVNPNRFGPETDNELIEGEGEIEIEGVTKHNTSWTIAPGYYTFTFITEDPENLMLVVEKTGDLPEPLEPTSYSDRVSSSVEQGTNTFDYYLEYTVVRNADKTLTIEPTYVFKGDEPTGKVDTYNIYIDANEGGRLYVGEGNNDGEGRTTTGTTFNDGDVVKITFTKAISMKNMEDVVSYTVGSEQEMPEMPEDPEPTNELVEVWKKENVYTAAYGNVRSGTGVNGKAYFSDYNGSKKTYAVDANGISEFVTVDGVATGITSDDAGNIIVNRGHGGAGSGINMTVISADGKTQNNITLTMPEGVSNGMTMGIGRAIGDILSDEGGYFYLAEQNQNKVVMIQMKNGKQVAAKASAEMKYAFDATTVAHPILSMDQIAEAADAQTLATTTKISDPENYFAVRVRGNRYITLVEGDKVTNLPTTWNADAKKGTSTMDGFGIFTLGDETYQVLPVIINSTGSYGNEFQILNSKGEVIENFTLGNDKSGVPSYCGITARPISKTQAEIYIVYSNPDGQSTAMYTYGYYSEPEVTEPDTPEELPEIPEGAEVIYADGKLRENLNVENWYNAAINFTAANPTGADNQVFEFKAGNLTYDWGQAGYTEASMGLNMVKPANTGIFHDATLNFGFYPTAASGAKYTVRLTSVASKDYDFYVTEDQVGKWNTMSLKMSEVFPEVAQEWAEDANFGEGYVFSIIISQGTEDDVMYLNHIYYTDVDTEWEAPEHIIPAPETVPVPEQAAKDVVSVFSSAYEPEVTFGIGNWNQSTVATVQDIDDAQVYYLRNFNYLGWELTSDLDVTDYDYLHVDYWTADEGAGFGITPVTREGTVKEKGIEQEVALNEWNSYDLALSDFAEAGMDLSAVFQIKFDFGKNKDGYVANVYFWKEPAPTFDPENKDHFAYNLKADGEANSTYTITFNSTGDVDDAYLVLTNEEGDTYEESIGAVYAGENTYTFDASVVDKTSSWNWAIRLHNAPVAENIVTNLGAVGGSRAGLATFTDPEFPETYGYTVVGRTQNGGIDVYNPNGQLEQSAVHAGCAVLGNTNTSSPMDATTRGNEVYLASWGDASVGVVAYDLTTPDTAPYAVFEGTKEASGKMVTDDGVATGSGTPCVGVWGEGDETTIITFDEDIFANKLTMNVIGNAKTTANPAQLIGNGFNAQLANTNVGVAVTKGGFFASQCRANGMEETTSGLRYFARTEDGNFDSVWKVFDQAEENATLLPSALAGIDITRDESKIIVPGYDAIYIYDVTWNDNVPTLSNCLTITNPYGRQSTRTNARFDAAGNIYLTQQSAGFYRITLANEEGAKVTTPAPKASLIESFTGVENIAVDAQEDGAVYYNLNGVKMPAGAKLPAGVYVKVVGKTATKVVVK